MFMAKNKSSEIPHYELLYIIANKFTEDEVTPINATVKALIETNGGIITFSEVWGKKKFMYKIKGFMHGYYNLFEFDANSQAIEKINRELRMSSEILRHMIVVKKKRTLEEIEREKQQVKLQMQKEAKAVLEQKEATEKKIEKKEVKEVKKVNYKDLDEKLDKILETDDLI